MSDLIEAISRGCKGTLADGAVRYVVEIDPRFAADAAKLFGFPGTALVIATLKPGAIEPTVSESLTTEKPKGGELAKWAAILCHDEKFWEWLSIETERLGYLITNNDEARMRLIEICGITSRSELDHSKEAANIFREQIMSPFNDWKELRLKL